MPEDQIRQFSTSDLDSLHHLSDLLHLFHHRNKNQHHRSIWWRHFSTFRRQLNSLLSEIKSLHEVPTTHLLRSRKKGQDRETKEVISNRIEFWRDVLVPKWHFAFSQIVTEGRFAVLGLVLIAAMAQICQIVGINSEFDEAEVGVAEQTLQNFEGAGEEHNVERTETSLPDGEDLGEVINREKLTREAKEDEVDKQTATAESRDDSKRSKSGVTRSNPGRKRRKKGNAIDDLFSGLG